MSQRLKIIVIVKIMSKMRRITTGSDLTSLKDKFDASPQRPHCEPAHMHTDILTGIRYVNEQSSSKPQNTESNKTENLNETR